MARALTVQTQRDRDVRFLTRLFKNILRSWQREGHQPWPPDTVTRVVEIILPPQ